MPGGDLAATEFQCLTPCTAPLATPTGPTALWCLLQHLQKPSTAPSIRAKALHQHWITLCRSLGPTRTRNELIVLVQDFIREEEVLLDELPLTNCEPPTLVMPATASLKDGCDAKSVSALLPWLLPISVPFVGGDSHIECLLDVALGVCASSIHEQQHDDAHAALIQLIRVVKDNEIAVSKIARRVDDLFESKNLRNHLTLCRLYSTLLDCVTGDVSRSVRAADMDWLLKTFFHLCRSRFPLVRRRSTGLIAIVINAFFSPKSITMYYQRAKPHKAFKTVAFKHTRSKVNASGDDTLNDLKRVISDLAADPSESVRLGFLEALPAIMDQAHITLPTLREDLINLHKQLGDDPSWMVRCNALRQWMALTHVLKAFPSQVEFTLHLLLTGLGDSEGEVRLSALQALSSPQMTDIFSEHTISLQKQAEVLELLRVILLGILNDSDTDLKLSLADTLISIAELFDPMAATQALFMVFTECLKDPCPEVRLRAFRSLLFTHELPTLNATHQRPEIDTTDREDLWEFPEDDYLGVLHNETRPIGDRGMLRRQFFASIKEDGLSSAAQALAQVANAPQWRLRRALLILIPQYLENLEDQCALYNFSVNFTLQSLSDPVHAVRITSATCIALLLKINSHWVDLSHLQATLASLVVAPNYLFRITAARCLATISGFRWEVQESQSLESNNTLEIEHQDFWSWLSNDVFKSLAEDRVSNVRTHLFLWLHKAASRFLKKKNTTIPPHWCLIIAQHARDDTSADARAAAALLSLYLSQIGTNTCTTGS